LQISEERDGNQRAVNMSDDVGGLDRAVWEGLALEKIPNHRNGACRQGGSPYLADYDALHHTNKICLASLALVHCKTPFPPRPRSYVWVANRFEEHP
jgi:hypothetical protein